MDDLPGHGEGRDRRRGLRARRHGSPRSVTQDIALVGAEGYQAAWNQRNAIAARHGLHPARIEHLLNRFGTLAEEVLALVDERPELGAPVPGADDYLQAELVYATTHEGALHLDDVLARRTRISIEAWDRGVSAAPVTARLMAEVLGWDDEHERARGGDLPRAGARRAREPDHAGRRVGRPGAARGAGDRAGRVTEVVPGVPGRRTLRQEMLRPRSLGMLLLALVLAATFAALGQWQLGRAVQSGTVIVRPTETVRQLSAIAKPQSQQTDASVGQLVTTSGSWVARDFRVIGDRLNRGEKGYWVVGHAVVDEPSGASLAVGLGWTKDEATARQAAARLAADPPAPGVLSGRYVDSDPAEPTTAGSPTALSAVSTARLVNLWSQPAVPVYEGVLTLRSAPAGLTAIYSPRPEEQVELNFLNIFYAAEWALFAVAAFYVWYRLVRDRWELEGAPVEDREAEPAGASGGPVGRA